MSSQPKKKRRGLFYSRNEERINTLSHGAGILMGIVVGIILLTKCQGNAWAIFGVSLYLFGMCSSYITSTLYHALPHRNSWKKRVRHWDHAAIYWHIAGSFSPFTLIVLREEAAWGWSVFSFIWLCALAGTIISFQQMKEHSYLETICYIVMGLSIMVVFKLLYEIIPVSVYWILGEGVCYITGAAFYSLRKVRYTHSIFHFFVLGGSICHIVAVWILLAKMFP